MRCIYNLITWSSLTPESYTQTVDYIALTLPKGIAKVLKENLPDFQITYGQLLAITEASLLAEFLPLGLRRSSSLKAIALSCLWDGGGPGQRAGQRLFGEVFGAFFAISCIFGAFWTHLS